MKGQAQIFSHNSDEWCTPLWLFAQLNDIYHFTLDPCATDKNALCAEYYTKEYDGLVQSWENERVFVNPPYSDIGKWVEKCRSEWEVHNILVVLLVPHRSCTSWYHDHILGKAQVTPIRGRLQFENGSTKNSAPFPSIVCTFMPELRKPLQRRAKVIEQPVLPLTYPRMWA